MDNKFKLLIRPCAVCGGEIPNERLLLSPRTKTCSKGCSFEYQYEQQKIRNKKWRDKQKKVK